jgi:hypothetical protein
MKEERKRTGPGYCLFIARVCPAAGEPDLKTSPPRKNGSTGVLKKQRVENEQEANSAFGPPPTKRKGRNNADGSCEHPQGTF